MYRNGSNSVHITYEHFKNSKNKCDFGKMSILPISSAHSHDHTKLQLNLNIKSKVLIAKKLKLLKFFT